MSLSGCNSGSVSWLLAVLFVTASPAGVVHLVGFRLDRLSRSFFAASAVTKVPAPPP